MKTIASITLLTVCALGCGSGGESSSDTNMAGKNAMMMDSNTSTAGGSMGMDAAPMGGQNAVTGIPNLPPIVQGTVDKVLTYSATQGGLTYIYAADAKGENVVRLTPDSAPWSYHALDPTGRYLVAVKQASTLDDNRPNVNSAGEIWIFDFESQEKAADGSFITDVDGTPKPLSYPISPADCSAGIGGVGWASNNTIAFAMACDGEASKAYVAQSSEKSRDATKFKVISSHDGAVVRDVNPVPGSSFFTYVVDGEVCVGGNCVTKPAIWVGDIETPSIKCGVTDGDRQFNDLSSHGDTSKRIGDHSPALGPMLQSLTFTRNVGGKTLGASGHFDLMSVQIDSRILFAGGDRCNVPGTEKNLSEEFGDRYAVDGDNGPKESARERFLQTAVGSRAPAETLLYVVRAGEGEAETSILYKAHALDGKPVALTTPDAWVIYGRWFVDDFNLAGGER